MSKPTDATLLRNLAIWIETAGPGNVIGFDKYQLDTVADLRRIADELEEHEKIFHDMVVHGEAMVGPDGKYIPIEDWLELKPKEKEG